MTDRKPIVIEVSGTVRRAIELHLMSLGKELASTGRYVGDKEYFGVVDLKGLHKPPRAHKQPRKQADSFQGRPETHPRPLYLPKDFTKRTDTYHRTLQAVLSTDINYNIPMGYHDWKDIPDNAQDMCRRCFVWGTEDTRKTPCRKRSVVILRDVSQ